MATHALWQLAEAGGALHSQHKRAQEAEALKLLDMVLKVRCPPLVVTGQPPSFLLGASCTHHHHHHHHYRPRFGPTQTQEPKYCEGLSRRVATQTVSRLIHGLEDEEEEEGAGAGAGAAGALTPASVTRAQCLANLLANYRCVHGFGFLLGCVGGNVCVYASKSDDVYTIHRPTLQPNQARLCEGQLSGGGGAAGAPLRRALRRALGGAARRG
jgi:hypothetical protein